MGERPRSFPGVGGLRKAPPKAKVLWGQIRSLLHLSMEEAGHRECGAEEAGGPTPAQLARRSRGVGDPAGRLPGVQPRRSPRDVGEPAGPPLPSCVPAGQGLSEAGAPGAGRPRDRECLVRIPISCRSVWISWSPRPPPPSGIVRAARVAAASSPRHMVARPFLRRARLPRLAAVAATAGGLSALGQPPARASRPAGCSRRRRRLLLSAATAAIGRPKRAGAQASAPPPGSRCRTRDGIMPSGPPGPGELRGARAGSAGPRGGLVGAPLLGSRAERRRHGGGGRVPALFALGSWPWASQGRARPSGGLRVCTPEARGWGGWDRPWGVWRALPKRGPGPADRAPSRTTAALSRARRRKVPRRFWSRRPGPRPQAPGPRLGLGAARQALDHLAYSERN